MVTESDRIRAEIATTRSELAEDVSALADRTSPKRMAQRRWDAVRYRAQSVRDRVMGASVEAKESVSDKASDMASTVSDKASNVASAVREMPQAVTRQAQGSPIGAGLIAFGIGLVAAAVIPETRQERRLGAQVAERAGEVMEPVRSLASDIGEDIKSSAGQAASEVGQTAKDAAADTAEQARQSAQTAKEQITR